MSSISVQVNFPAGIEITADLRRTLVATATSIAYAKIVSLAKAQLGKTKGDYLRAVQPPEFSEDGSVAVIRLDGVFPNMLEGGWAGGDQRPFLIDRNAKKRIGKNGKAYAFIPFGHEAADIPPHVLAIARSLAATKTAIGGSSTLWGGRLKSGLVAKSKPHHATDQFSGMYRTEKVYRRAKQSGFKTFRTISWTNLRGWNHPGLVARRFFPQARDAVLASMDAIVASAIAQTMGGSQ